MARSLPIAISLALVAVSLITTPAQANTVDAIAQRLANAWKLRVTEQLDVPMASARISLGATLEQSLDSEVDSGRR